MASTRLVLTNYDPAWPVVFADERSRLATALSPPVVQIEHVGSTAVPQLLAKPVLDIAAAVTTERDADACIEPLRALGYEYRGLNGDDPARRYYVLNRNGRRVVQIHLYILPARGWDEMLRFRDALREDAALAAAYAAEKCRVADLVAWNKSAYADAKGPFVRATLDSLEAR